MRCHASSASDSGCGGTAATATDRSSADRSSRRCRRAASVTASHDCTRICRYVMISHLPSPSRCPCGFALLSVAAIALLFLFSALVASAVQYRPAQRQLAPPVSPRRIPPLLCAYLCAPRCSLFLLPSFSPVDSPVRLAAAAKIQKASDCSAALHTLALHAHCRMRNSKHSAAFF